MKKLLYILALFILKSQAQTHNFSPAGEKKDEKVKLMYFLKASGEVTNPDSWGTNPDGTGEKPASFSTDAIFKIANRKGDVALGSNWMVRNIEIGNGINLTVGPNTLTIKDGLITYIGSGKIKGSPNSSIIIGNNEKALTLVFDSTVPGKSNALKSLTIDSETQTPSASSVTFGSDIHIYGELTLHGGDLIIGNHNISLKSDIYKQASFQTPGVYQNRASLIYNGWGRFLIDHVKADGKSIVTLVAQPFTESIPSPDNSSQVTFGAMEESPKIGTNTELEISKNLIQDDIKLFINIKFLDFFTKVNIDPLYC